MGHVSLHHSGWGFGRSPLEFSTLFRKITGTSQPAGLGLEFELYKGNPSLMIRYPLARHLAPFQIQPVKGRGEIT